MDTFIIIKAAGEITCIQIARKLHSKRRSGAEILNAVGRKLELEHRKEKLSMVKKGLMNELLTGRKRVKVMAETG